jgi:hypothetical protein
MVAGPLPACKEDGSHDKQYCTQTGASEASQNSYEIINTRNSKCPMGTRLEVQPLWQEGLRADANPNKESTKGSLGPSSGT